MVIAVHSVNVIVRQLERNINQYAGEETAMMWRGVNPFDFFLYLCVVSMNDVKFSQVLILWSPKMYHTTGGYL